MHMTIITIVAALRTVMANAQGEPGWDGSASKFQITRYTPAARAARYMQNLPKLIAYSTLLAISIAGKLLLEIVIILPGGYWGQCRLVGGRVGWRAGGKSVN